MFEFFHFAICTSAQKQTHRLQLVPVLVQSAARLRNLADSVAVLLAVLGSTSVEMMATRNLITLGSRASRPAKVRSR